LLIKKGEAIHLTARIALARAPPVSMVTNDNNELVKLDARVCLTTIQTQLNLNY